MSGPSLDQAPTPQFGKYEYADAAQGTQVVYQYQGKPEYRVGTACTVFRDEEGAATIIEVAVQEGHGRFFQFLKEEEVVALYDSYGDALALVAYLSTPEEES